MAILIILAISNLSKKNSLKRLANSKYKNSLISNYFDLSSLISKTIINKELKTIKKKYFLELN